MKKLLVLSTALLVLAGQGALAQQKKKAMVDDMSGQGYGMAGCGLGSIVFGEKPGMVQIFAATSNGVSGNQTFGITSGTSNCPEAGSKQASASQFIEVNRIALENDLARGQGETLASLSQVLECKNANFPSQLKTEYSASFPKGGASSEQLEAVAYKACSI